jgi:predicted amidophosphoribosyltransferase
MLQYLCPKCGAELPQNATVCPKCEGKGTGSPYAASETESQVCPKCGIKTGYWKTCDNCGTPLEAVPLKPCLDCGKAISQEAAFCPHCGRTMKLDYSKKLYTLHKWVTIISASAIVLWGIWFFNAIYNARHYYR